MKAMVLAAGKGTRLSPLTQEIPKPMAPVAGKPIIEHIFELLGGAGVDEVHVNVYHLADAILERYGQESRMNSMRLNVSRESRLMGTAGGVKRLSDRFKDTFVVIMGDALTDVDLREVVTFHKERGALATLALTPVEDTSEYGVVALDGANNILAFQEKPHPREAISTLANTGIYVLEPEALEYIPKDTFFDFAKDLFPKLLSAGESFVGYQGSFYWSDIGNLEAYRAAQRDVLSGRVRVRIPGDRWGDSLWVERGARIHPTVNVRGVAAIGHTAMVGPAVTLDGDVTVGSGCSIAPGATIRRSILLPGASVGRGAHLEDCIVGSNRQVWPEERFQGEVVLDQDRIQGVPSMALSRSA